MSDELSVTRIGHGRPDLVFLHGLFGQGRNWASIAKDLEPRVSLLVDLPNHGRSPWTTTVDYDAMADTLARDLELGGAAERPVTVVGHSMGGKVAMRLALRHPRLVSRLVVVDISPVAGSTDEFARLIDALRGLDLTLLTDRQAADDALAASIPDERVRSFLLANLRRGSSGWEWQVNLDLLRRELARVGGWEETSTPPWPGPVLWVAGADSPYVRPEHGLAMRALFPHTRLVRIKGAGHWVHADAPAALVATLRAFLTEPVGVGS